MGTGRCTTGTSPTAIAANAVATWIPMGENVPTVRTRTVACTRVAAIDIATNTAKAIDVPGP
jgi:hypothetical protein